MKFKLFKADGTSSEERDVPHFPAMEDGKGKDALRQVIIATHANQRQGNASTKTRSEVAGSGKKMHRQKGLGVGRVGDKRYHSTPRRRSVLRSAAPILQPKG